MIKYKASLHLKPQITEMNIVRETDYYFFYLNHKSKQQMELKEYGDTRWFDTKQEAIEYIRAYFINKIESVKTQLQYREEKLKSFNTEYPV